MKRTGEKNAMGIPPANATTAALCEPASENGMPDRLPDEDAVDPRQSFSETEQVMLSLAKVVEERDRVTSGHCERLAITGVELGVAMKLDRPSLLALFLGGYLHDIGKVGIPDSVLFKPGKLNEEEWQIMRTHSARGEEICRPLSSLSCVLPIIRHHHERWDGSGYPDRLSGAGIPLLARILQVADIYDALTNTRPYRQASPTAQALEVLEEEVARGWRDPEITGLFILLHKRMLPEVAGHRLGDNDEQVSMQDSLDSLRNFLAS